MARHHCHCVQNKCPSRRRFHFSYPAAGNKKLTRMLVAVVSRMSQDSGCHCPYPASENLASATIPSSPSPAQPFTSKPKLSRKNRISALQEWATSENIGIQIATQRIVLQEASDSGGLGWYSSDSGVLEKGGAVVLSVPSAVALTVQCPGEGPDDSSVATALFPTTTATASNSKLLSNYPLFVQMALYLYKLDRVDSCKMVQGKSIDYSPWLNSLPRQFDTPLHWSTTDMGLLQYPHLVRTVAQQRFQWQRYYESLMIPNMTWEDFVWASECARSRAFAGTFAGQAFDARIYAFTLLLVTAYVGLGLGTLEQAANGAGLVLAASILKGTKTAQPVARQSAFVSSLRTPLIHVPWHPFRFCRAQTVQDQALCHLPND
jgi:hypothetical protein